MRRLYIGLGVVAVLLAGAIFALPHLIDADHFRPLLKSELEKSLRRRVELGALSLSIFPLALEAKDVVIGEDPAFFRQRPFAKAQKLAVRIDIFGLLRRQLNIDSMRVANPLIELIRDAKGRWNTDSLTARDGSSSPLQLTEVRIDHGRVALATPDHPRAEYQNIDVQLRDYGSGRPSPLSVTAHMPDNRGALTFKGTLNGSAVAGDLAMKDCALPALEAALGRPLFGTNKADGTLSGQAKITNAAKAWSAAGNLDLRSPTHGNVTATYKLDSKADLVRVDQFDARIGHLNLRVTGTVNSGRLALRLHAADAPIGELAKLAAGFGIAFAPGMVVQGTVGADLAITGTTAAPLFDGQVRAAKLEMRGGELKQPVRTAALTLDLTPERLTARPFEVQSGSTRLNGGFSLAQYSSQRPQLEATVTVPKSSLADLVGMAQAYGLHAARGVRATGEAAVEAHISGPLAKGSALQYRGTGLMEGATIETTTLTRPVMVRSARLRFEGESVGVEALDATIGQTTLTGRIASRNDHLDFALSADKVDIDELRNLTKTSKANESSPLSGNGTMTIGTLKMDRLILTNVRTTVTTAGKQIRLDPLTANIYGGLHTGTIVVDQRTATPTYTLNSKLERIDSAQLLEAVSSLRQLVGGPLSATANLTLSPKPNEDLMKSLDGTLGFRFTEGKIYSMNLLGEIGKLAQFLNRTAPEKYTSFLAFTGDLNLTKGVANTDNLKLDMNNATITMAGLLNLVDQTINLRMRTLLNKKLAEEVGGSRIGGYLTAAISGPAGDMTIPSLVTGTFSNPRFTPDAAAIAKLKLRSIVPGITSNPKTVIDAITGNKEGVQGLIDLFKGKKKSP